jgi:hypothetical protein
MPFLCKGNIPTDFPKLISTSINQLRQRYQSNTTGVLAISSRTNTKKKVRFLLGRWKGGGCKFSQIKHNMAMQATQSPRNKYKGRQKGVKFDSQGAVVKVS